MPKACLKDLALCIIAIHSSLLKVVLFVSMILLRAIPIFPCLSDHLVREVVFFPSEHKLYSGKQRKANEEKRKEAERIQQMEDEIRRPTKLPPKIP